MQRRQFLINTALTAGSVALLVNKSFASMLADPTYQFKPLRNNVGMFAEQGGTIAWLVNKEGIVVVDAEFPDPATHLIAELKKQSDLPFQWLINTHHHGDHTSGNISFKGIAKNVAAHANSLTNQKAVAVQKQTEDKQLYPDTTYTDKWKIKVGDEHITAHYFGAGHTNGDSFIHFENANIVHTGDLVFNRRYPFVDRSAGASCKSWITVLEKAQKQFDKNTLFVFGHAFDPQKVTGNMDDVKAMHHFMESLVTYVDSSIKAGKSKEDILAIKTIPGVTEWQGDGIERGLTAAYEELSA
ncbi:Glyoxylase, beta-lactamase superfamily II [Mucilaginibacter lappiensis]|uniref:Glyoxylase-like metal-dependent hydrolase (Beta-lactamase superfamily II) n=1 Tax=Mucilaginibacter lappiensis TaxID=354630 RepID=A0ABR6PV86_9SPHI|nr:MBL fold metallo-hydrolase [Mucilaginibacter lappiensis]MBB6112231.1 glyoxylase-like metal-dependent hydrolase (beta-lactamase superfamily II) [Mucilaginibacter lappiensis]SIR98537.1 Glyoxylase, beta-lactamase superfamily II [Mucilaginibacter lappiensis]